MLLLYRKQWLGFGSYIGTAYQFKAWPIVLSGFPERAIILLKGLWLGLIMQGDIQSVEDLTYGNRKDFIARYPLPKELPIVSFHTKASTDGSGLCKMSTIRKLAIEPLLRGIKVPLAIPMAAAMAFCASYLKRKFGGESDGLVMRVDAEVPGSAVVKPDVKLHHAWMVFRSSGTKGNNPNPSQMCEALFLLLLEEAATKSGSSSAHARTSKDANSNPDYLSAEISAAEDYLTDLEESYSGYDSGE